MNQTELREFLRARRLRDEWWVCVDGQTEPQPINIATLMTRRKRYQGKDVALLQTSLVNTDKEEWIEFESSESAQVPRLKLPKAAEHSDASALDARLDSLTEEVVEIRKTMNDWQCLMSDLVGKISTLSDALNTHMSSAEAGEQLEKLNQRLNELDTRERDLQQRERYIQSCEDRLIDMTYQQEETAAEIATLADGQTLPN